MEGSRQVVTDKLWLSLKHNQGLSSSHIETVKRRVETVRASLKPSRHQRPDCRDIFRDADQVIILSSKAPYHFEKMTVLEKESIPTEEMTVCLLYGETLETLSKTKQIQQHSDGSSGSRSSSATPEYPDLLDWHLSKTSLENMSDPTTWAPVPMSHHQMPDVAREQFRQRQMVPASHPQISVLPSTVHPFYLKTRLETR